MNDEDMRTRLMCLNRLAIAEEQAKQATMEVARVWCPDDGYKKEALELMVRVCDAEQELRALQEDAERLLLKDRRLG